VTGAGDTVIAALALGMAPGRRWPRRPAGQPRRRHRRRRFGPATVSPAELISEFADPGTHA